MRKRTAGRHMQCAVYMSKQEEEIRTKHGGHRGFFLDVIVQLKQANMQADDNELKDEE